MRRKGVLATAAEIPEADLGDLIRGMAGPNRSSSRSTG